MNASNTANVTYPMEHPPAPFTRGIINSNHQKSKIINHKSKDHGKERNLEQGITSGYHDTYRYSNHLRGDIVHGHVAIENRKAASADAAFLTNQHIKKTHNI